MSTEGNGSNNSRLVSWHEPNYDLLGSLSGLMEDGSSYQYPMIQSEFNFKTVYHMFKYSFGHFCLGSPLRFQQNSKEALTIVEQPAQSGKWRYRSDFQLNNYRKGYLKAKSNNSNYRGPTVQVNVD